MKIVNVIAASVLAFGATSCAMLEEFLGEGTVFTTADQLQEGQQGAVIPWEQLPEEIKAKVPEGTMVVMADKEQLKEDAAYIPAAPGGEDIGAMIDAGFGIASTFLPGLAAWEGVVTLFSQRKRKHYIKAAKALVPHKGDTSVDLVGTVKAIGAGLGMAHSSEASKVAAEDDSEWEYEEVPEETVV
jgi:hypothetical protein